MAHVHPSHSRLSCRISAPCTLPSQASPRPRLASAQVPAHLCFSLILIGAMPRPPSEMDDEAESAEPLNTDRTTLDISLDDEETFGYWVAALRALVSEVRNKPVAYASPLNPMHASAAASLRKDAPPDATMLEKLRDASLLCLDWYSKTWFFMIFTAIWALGGLHRGAAVPAPPSTHAPARGFTLILPI